MIIRLSKQRTAAQERALKEFLAGRYVQSEDGLSLGITEELQEERLLAFGGVEEISHRPYFLSSREFCSRNTVVSVGKARFGEKFAVIAGPCAVEGPAQICEIARRVAASGADVLRGGAYKPRTSPYAFCGRKETGLRELSEAKEKSGLPVVSELTGVEALPLFGDVDLLQVGARNMQNFDLLRKLGELRRPVLLKRGSGNTVEELLASAEYLLSAGNREVILCERGIRTFENATRNTLDLSAVAVLKKRTHLPVIVDPSHATGHAEYVPAMALAALAAGADGLMIEVHNHPAQAFSDAAQALSCEEFDSLMKKIRALESVLK